ncbi:MAG: phage integrase N-terminal SAM-like domain-containing protein, partial [Ferruginibacter sp.]
MNYVTLTVLDHRNHECIGIHFSNIGELNNVIKKLPHIKWSRTHTCWYVPLSKENYTAIVTALHGIAEINNKALYVHLSAKKKDLQYQLKIAVPKKKPAHANIPLPFATIESRHEKITGIQPVNAHVLPALEQQLLLKAYSGSTIKTYTGEMSRLLQLLQHKAADHLTAVDIKRYLLYCYQKLQLSENTLHSRMNALKFYYEQVLGNEKIFWEIPRPKKPIQLPHFFNQDEIAQIIKHTANIKHKTMLMLAYSTGMRVSEVTRLKVMHIDS